MRGVYSATGIRQPVSAERWGPKLHYNTKPHNKQQGIQSYSFLQIYSANVNMYTDTAGGWGGWYGRPPAAESEGRQNWRKNEHFK